MSEPRSPSNDFAADLARLTQIRRAQLSARPTSQNPAWLNAHHDCNFLLSFIDKYSCTSRS